MTVHGYDKVARGADCVNTQICVCATASCATASDPLGNTEWAATRAKFRCPHGVTNVWNRPALRGPERVLDERGRAAHPNQKPLDLMTRIIEASSDPGDVVWEPFGGLFTASLAATRLGRRAFGAEIDERVFRLGAERVRAAGIP